jgi:hypothetical protein
VGGAKSGLMRNGTVLMAYNPQEHPSPLPPNVSREGREEREGLSALMASGAATATP